MMAASHRQWHAPHLSSAPRCASAARLSAAWQADADGSEAHTDSGAEAGAPSKKDSGGAPAANAADQNSNEAITANIAPSAPPRRMRGRARASAALC